MRGPFQTIETVLAGVRVLAELFGAPADSL